MNVERLQTLSILIVEDDVDNRETLQSVSELKFAHVYTAADGCQGLDAFVKYQPDVVISDIEMPCMTGLEMLTKIRKLNSKAIFVFTTAYSDEKRLLEAIDLSVDGYVIKPIVYREVLEKIISKLPQLDEENSLLEKLSKRELEVFTDMAKGLKPAVIASKYELKPKTVGTYRRRILEKLQLNSNAELIKYALRCKVL